MTTHIIMERFGKRYAVKGESGVSLSEDGDYTFFGNPRTSKARNPDAQRRNLANWNRQHPQTSYSSLIDVFC